MAENQRLNPGPPLPDGWQATLLTYLEQYGTYWKACRHAGVSDDTVRRYRQLDPDFDTACKHARELHADQLEEDLTAEPGVVGKIVMLKKFRPHDFIERNLSMSVTMTAELPAVDAVALIHAMLGAATDATRQQLGLTASPPALPTGDA